MSSGRRIVLPGELPLSQKPKHRIDRMEQHIRAAELRAQVAEALAHALIGVLIEREVIPFEELAASAEAHGVKLTKRQPPQDPTTQE